MDARLEEIDAILPAGFAFPEEDPFRALVTAVVRSGDRGRLDKLAALCSDYLQELDLSVLLRRLVLDQELASLGEEHTDVASTLIGLANMFETQGRLDEALDHYKRALAIMRKALGEEHTSVADSLMGMGLVFKAQGRLDEALDHYERALAIKRKALGEEHTDVADILYKMALLKKRLSDGGGVESARALFLRCADIYAKTYGSDDADTRDALEQARRCS